MLTKFHLSKRCKGVNIKPNLSISDLQGFWSSVTSKGQFLSLCNSVDDPIGLALPYIFKLRLLMGETLLSQNRIKLSN